MAVYGLISAVRIPMKKHISDLNSTSLKLLPEATGVCGDLRPNQLILLTIQSISQKWDPFKYSVRIGFISKKLNCVLTTYLNSNTEVFWIQLRKKSRNCNFFAVYLQSDWAYAISKSSFWWVVILQVKNIGITTILPTSTVIVVLWTNSML